KDSLPRREPVNTEPARCDQCGRVVNETDAMFCAGCGAPVRPVTVPVVEPPAAPVPKPQPSPPRPLPPQVVEPGDNRAAAIIAVASAAIALIGAFQVWLRIT